MCVACLIRETNGLKYGSWKKEVAQNIHTTSNQLQASNEQIIAVMARILIAMVKVVVMLIIALVGNKSNNSKSYGRTLLCTKLYTVFLSEGSFKVFLILTFKLQFAVFEAESPWLRWRIGRPPRSL